MVKKLKAMAQAKDESGQLAATIKASAQQIWLAGLGAFAKAQEEGGKVFEALVKEGNALQRRTRSYTEDKLGEVGGRVTQVAGSVGKQASVSWDRLEQVFEDRVARALGRLGVPTRKDVETLVRRVEELNRTVKGLPAAGARRARAAAAAGAKRTSSRATAAKSPKSAAKASAKSGGTTGRRARKAPAAD